MFGIEGTVRVRAKAVWRGLGVRVWVKVVWWSRYKDKLNVLLEFLDFLELPFCGWWLYLFTFVK